MSDPAILLGEAIRILASMTPRPPNLTHVLNLVREAKGNLEAAPVQAVDHAGVCRFLAHLRESKDDDSYVSSYIGEVDETHAIDGIWSTEDLRAAILAALGEK